MEAAIPGVVQGASVLLPVAYYVARGCWKEHMRKACKIQKHVLCIPSKGGKSLLYHRLASQKQYLVVDVDEYLSTVCDDKELSRLRMSQDSGNFLQESIYYAECADKVLAFMRNQLKKNSGLKVLFITSCWAWASRFRYDSSIIACPGKDFFAQILERFPDDMDALRLRRDEFLEAVPRKAVQIYNSYEGLEDLVRKRLNLIHTL